MTGQGMVVADGGVMEIRDAAHAPGIRDTATVLDPIFNSPRNKDSEAKPITVFHFNEPLRLEAGGKVRAAMPKRGALNELRNRSSDSNQKRGIVANGYVALIKDATPAGGTLSGPLHVLKIGSLRVESPIRIAITGDFYLDGAPRRQTATSE